MRSVLDSRDRRDLATDARKRESWDEIAEAFLDKRGEVISPTVLKKHHENKVTALKKKEKAKMILPSSLRERTLSLPSVPSETSLISQSVSRDLQTFYSMSNLGVVPRRAFSQDLGLGPRQAFGRDIQTRQEETGMGQAITLSIPKPKSGETLEVIQRLSVKTKRDP